MRYKSNHSCAKWMAIGFVLFVGAGVGAGAGADLATSQKFQVAEQTFADAATPNDYLKAAGLYQEILDNGVVSGAVLYNLGNALMKAGQRGRAIAAYRQALRYRPRDPYLNANLRFALGPQQSATQRKRVLETILFWQGWLSYPEKFYLTTAAVSLVLASALFARLSSAHAAIATRLKWTAILVTFVAALSNAYDWYQIECTRHGVVIEDKTVARKGNSTSYEPAFTEPLSEGTEFVVVEQRPSWFLIRHGSAGEGWVPTRSVVVY